MALGMAARLAELCAGCAERWEVAGSLRRGRTEVGDVEIVAIPRIVTPAPPAPERDLFGAAVGSPPAPAPVNLLLARLDELVASGTVRRALKCDGKERWGERYRSLVVGDEAGVQIELWLTTALSWGSALTIRTGPAKFSAALQPRLHRAGLGNHNGEVRHRVVIALRGPDGRPVVEYRGDPIPVPEEADYFRLCEVPYCPPEQRDAVAAHLAAVGGPR